MHIFNGELFCDSCAEEIASRVETDNDDYDERPQFVGDSGEADCPQHCGGCGAFLGNPLTEEGETYVLSRVNDALEEGELPYPLDEWADYYSYLDFASFGFCEYCDRWRRLDSFDLCRGGCDEEEN